MRKETSIKPPKAVSSFKNLSWNTTAFGIGIIVTFFVSPFLIRTLGDGRYGLLALIAEITGYYGLFDLGMRTAVSYFVARDVARNDAYSVDETMHNAFWLLAFAAGAVMLASIMVVYGAPHWFSIEGLTVNEARICIFIASVVFALSLPFSVFSAALYGLRRLDMVNGVDVAFRLGGTIPIVLLLRAGGGLVSFVILQGMLSLLRWFMEAWLVKRSGLAKDIAFPIRWNRRTMLDCLHYGMGNTTINISQLVANQLDLLVIATFLSTRWVTFFYIARTVCSYYASLISTITRTFTPQITHFHSKGQRHEMVNFYLSASRLAALVAAWLAVGIAFYGRPFLRMWVGNSYVLGDIYHRADIVLYVLLSGLFCRAIQSMGWQLLLGSRNLAFLTYLNIGEAIVNLSLSLLLVRRYGLLGVALGTAIPMWICYGFLMPTYIVGKYEIKWHNYLRSVVRPVLFTLVVFGLVCRFALTLLYPETWWQLFGSASAISVIYFSLVAWIELSKEERCIIAAKLEGLRRLVPAKQ